MDLRELDGERKRERERLRKTDRERRQAVEIENDDAEFVLFFSQLLQLLKIYRCYLSKDDLKDKICNELTDP